MAKAITVFLLLAATAAIAAAHPGFGKGGNFAVNVDANATADASKTFTIDKGHGHDLSQCQCKDDCKETTRKVCKEKTKDVEVCKDEDVEEEVEVCETKCFKADKVISIGKGRRMQGVVHGLAKAAVIGAVSHHTNITQGGQQEICREICKPQTKKSKKEKCKKEKKTELVDCKEEVTSRKCVKNCICGEKTITIGHTPDIGAIAAAIVGSHGKGK